MPNSPKPPPPGYVSLRAAAEALGMARKTMLRLMNQGMDGQHRQGERVYINVELARAWIEANKADQPTAPSLRHGDPRFRTAHFSARRDWLKTAISTGLYVPVSDVERRFADELTETRIALLQIPRSMQRGDFANLDFLRSELEGALAYLKVDDPATWPTQGEVIDEPAALDFGAADVEGVTYAPMYSESDPRFAFHEQKAARAQLQYDSLAESVVLLANAIKICGAEYDGIRERVREIPGAIELCFDPNDTEADPVGMLTDEIRTALAELVKAAADQVEADHDPFALAS